MDDESSDILGQQTKPVLRGGKNTGSPGLSLTVKLVFGFAVLLVLYAVVMRIWIRILVWKERSYKLAMRRRHGIPDNDHRPFNVAYAAVVRARQEREDVQKKATQPVLSSDRRNAQAEQNVRQRFGLQAAGEAPRASSYSSRLPGAYLTEGTPARYHTESSLPPPVVISTGRYPSQSRHVSARAYDNSHPLYSVGLRRASRIDIDPEDINGSQKRGFVEDPLDEQENAKRSKRDDWEIDDDVDGATWQDQSQPRRGAKRYLFSDDEGEDDFVERQPRDKRARKISLDKGIQAEGDDLDMDIDEEVDEVDDLPYIQRGKKRDRAEAGSTFGGDDDDDEDSGIDLESPESKHKRRTRKRRVFSKRKSDVGVSARGRKRDRDSENGGTDVESGDENSYVLRKKRGKQSMLMDDASSEHSTARSQTSSGSRNRKIGEEWSSNGIRWKVGPNGQRLRQALVKKTRQRFPMPEDSQHPDREIDFEVYVESWLNDEEYRDAKEQHLLAGQDTPQRLGSKLVLDVQANGKNLLWSSTSTPIDSPVSRSPVSERAHSANQRIIRTSLISSSSPRGNPFDQVPAQTIRRISSISRTTSAGAVGSPGLADSTNSSPHARYKTYSKLEKQELEAQALMKLRELKNKKDAEGNQAKDEQVGKQKENVSGLTNGATTSFAIPAITVTTPSQTSTPATQPSSLFNLTKPADNTSKPAETLKTPSLFPFPSSTDAPKPNEASQPSSFPTPPVPAAPKAADKPAAPAPPSSFFPLPSSSTPAQSTADQATSAKPLFNLPGATPTAFGSESKPDQPAKPSFFPTSVATTTVPTPAQSSNTSTTPLFSLGTQKAPEGSSGASTAQISSQSASQPSPFFNLSKPNALASTISKPSLFGTNTSQPVTQAGSSSASTVPNNQVKFEFKLPGSTGTSSSAPSTASAANATAQPAPTSISPFGNQFEVKGPSRPAVTFTPLTPDGGTKAAANASDKTGATSFGFKAPTSGVNSDASKPPVSVFGVTGGSSNPFSSAGASNTTSSTFGAGSPFNISTKPTDNKPAASSAQTTNPLFQFGVTSTSSSKDTPSQSTTSSAFGNATGGSAPASMKPAASSSSLFGALGSQQTNAFGATSAPGTTGTTGSSNIFGSTNASAPSSSSPQNVFNSTTNGTSSTANSMFGSQTAPNAAGGQAPAGIFGGQNNVTPSGSQPPNVFGNTGASNLFGAKNPAEAPKSVFGATSAPIANGTTSGSSEQPKPTFKFQLPSSGPTTGTSGATTTAAPAASSSSGPQFTFTFGANSSPTQAPVFGATSAPQSGLATKPGTFNVGSTFGSGGGSSGFNPLGTASQTQK